MAQTILVFDFGTDEEAAQQARHKIEGWKQGFRLGDKMLVKFEREAAAGASDGETAEVDEEKPAKNATAKGSKKDPAKKVAKESKAETVGKVRVLVRLGFSDHEKLTQQRWLDRIPAEEPFKSVQGETIRRGDPEFPKTMELFESLD